MTQHELKAEALFFDAIVEGKKPFDVRKDDRHFQTGDTVILHRGTCKLDEYRGAATDFVYSDPRQSLICTITYKLTRFPGLQEGYCILGLASVFAGASTISNTAPAKDYGQGVGIGLGLAAAGDSAKYEFPNVPCAPSPGAFSIARDTIIIGRDLGATLWDDLDGKENGFDGENPWESLTPRQQDTVRQAATHLFVSGVVSARMTPNRLN